MLRKDFLVICLSAAVALVDGNGVNSSDAPQCTIGQKCFVVNGCLACTPDCGCSSSPSCTCDDSCNPCQVTGGTDCCTQDGSGDYVLHCGSGTVAAPDKKSCIYPCAVTEVSGKWLAQFSVAAPTTITFKHGTTKTNDLSKTTTWSNEVTSHVQSAFKIFGFGGSASVDAKVGVDVASQCSQEWQMNDEEDFEVAFEDADVGKFVWQFQFAVDDLCNSGANPITKEYALTDGAWQQPCCIPGYCVDAPHCNTCHAAEYMISGADQPRCKVANVSANVQAEEPPTQRSKGFVV